MDASVLLRQGKAAKPPGSSRGIARTIPIELTEEESCWLHRALGSNYDLFTGHFSRGEFVVWEDLMPYLRYMLLYEGEMIGKYAGMDPDLSRRIIKRYRPYYGYNELIESLHARNRTDTAISRALLHIVLRMEEAYMEDGADPLIPYARVLGFARGAEKLLKEIREKAKTDIIQRPVLAGKLYMKHSVKMKMFMQDIRSAELYEQICAGKSGMRIRSEMSREQVLYR